MRRHIFDFLALSAFGVGGICGSQRPTRLIRRVITVRVGPNDKAEYLITTNGQKTAANWAPRREWADLQSRQPRSFG